MIAIFKVTSILPVAAAREARPRGKSARGGMVRERAMTALVSPAARSSRNKVRGVA
jgi:hypothetical protein